MTTDLTPSITDDEVAALPLAQARADLLRELLHSADVPAGTAGRHRRRPVVLAAAAAAAVVAVVVPASIALLGDDGPSGGAVATDPTAPAPTAAPPSFQIRYVGLTSTEPRPEDVEWQELKAYVCPDRPVAVPVDQAELACSGDGTKYLLGPAAVQGGVTAAQAAESPTGWSVTLQLDEESSASLEDITRQLVGSSIPLAVVLQGRVLATPAVASVIESGQMQIGGDLSRSDAETLAARLAPGR